MQATGISIMHCIQQICHSSVISVPSIPFLKAFGKKDWIIRNLERPLECGVTVIAAHCATPVFPLINKKIIRDFYLFMKSVNSDSIRLWADTSALSLSTRLPFISEILETFPPDWLVHGSDFPIPIDSWPHLPPVTHDITPEEYIKICRTKNPFDRDVRINRAHGFSELILERMFPLKNQTLHLR
jgi:hypothetical protein